MAGHLLFNSGSNESSLAPQFQWLDNTFNVRDCQLASFSGRSGVPDRQHIRDLICYLKKTTITYFFLPFHMFFLS